MRTRINLLMVTASLVFVAAGGRAFGAVTVDKQSGKGSNAGTSFSGSATIHCSGGGSGTVSASGFLSGSQSVTKSTGSPKTVNNGVFIEIDTYSNTCTGANLGFLTGGLANAFTPPNAHLNSAQILGSATVQDFNDVPNTLAVSLDVVFEGTGPVTAGKSTTVTKTKGPLTITINSSASASRAADASGDIKVGGVLLDTTFSVTTLSSNSNSTITITKK
jgi:hypothetical protein